MCAKGKANTHICAPRSLAAREISIGTRPILLGALGVIATLGSMSAMVESELLTWLCWRVPRETHMTRDDLWARLFGRQSGRTSRNQCLQ